MNYRLPRKTNKEKTFSVVSPSGEPGKNDTTIALLSEAEAFCQSKNIRFEFAKNWNKSFRGYAGTSSDRKESLFDAIENKSEVVISSIGGYGATSLLDAELLEKFDQKDKWFVGMSDTTSLLNALTYTTGLVTLYGLDVVWGLGKFIRGKAFDTFENILERHDFTLLEDFKFLDLSKGRETSGRLMGGCLGTFMSLIGTQFDPFSKINEDFIFVAEDVMTDLRRIEDYLYQLKFNNNFAKYCKGIILGNFVDCANKYDSNLTAEQLATEIFPEFPVFKSEHIGHGVINMPIPLGMKIQLKPKGVNFSASYSI